MAKNLLKNFLQVAALHSSRPAVMIKEQSLSYDALVLDAARIANALLVAGFQPGMLASILGMQSFSAYAGILGAMLAGGGYVPTNPRYPALRNQTIIKKSLSPFCILESDKLSVYGPVLDMAQPLIIIVDKGDSLSELRRQWPQHVFLAKTDHSSELPQISSTDKESIAYLLFTSGSTGEPKGVGISYGSLEHYIASLQKLAHFSCDERFMQMFDLTFDFSVHPLWLSFAHGATLYVENDIDRLMPANFLKRNQITQWNSVPTTIAQMNRLRQLKPGAFENIRYSVFCGEALPARLALAWLEAAPNSLADNLYGPTEATVACMYYRLNDQPVEADSVNGIVPIGEPFPDMRAAILPSGENDAEGAGELLLSGPQLASGYWRNEQLTREKFIHLPGDPETWYRTGDLARKKGSNFVFLGREDSQIKIKGYRVEISEVEGALMQLAKTSDLVALLAGASETAGELVAVFLQKCPCPEKELLESCRSILPEYMIPARIMTLEQFPRNNNGKIDRKAIRKLVLEALQRQSAMR